METEEVFRLVDIIRKTFYKRFLYSHLDIRDLEQETFLIGMKTKDFELAYTRSYYVGLMLLKSRFVLDYKRYSLEDHRVQKIVLFNEEEVRDFRLDLVSALAKLPERERIAIYAIAKIETQKTYANKISRCTSLAERIVRTVRYRLAGKLRFWRTKDDPC
jgi:DNA-directed RNA polymerase specialized sigma24 family protein